MSSAFFGELLATRCTYRKAIGAVIDGATRDVNALNNMGFPTFCRGISPYDSKGRLDVMRYGVTIECGGVPVNHGDLIYADIEGIAVIPKGIEQKVIKLALEKMKTEKIVREKLASGTTAEDVYKKYGVL
jgi:regulator of RNase E activity RraA